MPAAPRHELAGRHRAAAGSVVYDDASGVPRVRVWQEAAVNHVDLALIIMVGGAMMLGFYHGLVRQLAGIIGVIVAVILAGRYGGDVGVALTSVIDDAALTSIAGYVIVFLAVSSLVSLLASVLHRMVNLLFFGWLDQAGGALIGALQGCLIGAALYHFVYAFADAGTRDLLASSRVAALVVAPFSGIIEPLVPAILRLPAA
jgi:membrane protein required for colicin V production